MTLNLFFRHHCWTGLSQLTVILKRMLHKNEKKRFQGFTKKMPLSGSHGSHILYDADITYQIHLVYFH